MSTKLSVGLTATKAAWNTELRSYLRDHTHGVSVQVVMDRAQLITAVASIDVLVVDDVMRSFAASDIAASEASGVTVIGVFDPSEGSGAEYLASLGVTTVVSSATGTAQLAAMVTEVLPRSKSAQYSLAWSTWPGTGPFRRPRREDARAVLSVWSKASGGVGLSEGVVAAAEHLGRNHRVLLVELDEVAPSLAARLLRSPESGLNWAVSRAELSRPVLPDALSGERGDGVPPLGRFDVICGSQGPGQVVPSLGFNKLLDEVEGAYDHILVEASWLLGPVGERERFNATRSVLARADRVVVFSASDPYGAARLVDWRAAAVAAGVMAPCWAVFGRTTRSRYERAHLASLVTGNTGGYPFAGVHFLPEDPIVRRARWNCEMVWKGPWNKALRSLVSEMVAPGRHIGASLSWPRHDNTGQVFVGAPAR